jgi:hypothetical protein
MAEPIRETRAMIAGMTPRLSDGLWVYCTVSAPGADALAKAFATMREDEGVTLILPFVEATRLGYPSGPAMRRISLDLMSSLEGIGLTAAVATALTAAGIACNMVAAYHHDHVFVPEADAAAALATLRALQASA